MDGLKINRNDNIMLIILILVLLNYDDFTVKLVLS